MAPLKNGQLPESTLRRSVVGVDLRADASRSMDRIAKEFKKKAGIALVATDGYRELSGHRYAQREIFLARYEPRKTGGGTFGDVRWYNGVRYARIRGAAAAIPGTSNHGWGLAVDLGSGINVAFTAKNHLIFAALAKRHGWSNAEGRSVNEPWHWTYNPARDRYIWKSVKITGKLDKATIYSLQRALGRAVTAATTPAGQKALWKAVQKRLNKRGAYLVPDGIPGDATWTAVQRDLRAINTSPENRPAVTGKPNQHTIRAWQKALNAKKW